MLAELDIHPDDNELPLHIKDSLSAVPVFRRAEQKLPHYVLIDTPISSGMMNEWVKRIGELSGFEHATMSYSLRYMAGNNMDKNGTCCFPLYWLRIPLTGFSKVNVSEALCNFVMDHAPNSDTFQKHYLNRNVCADLWAIHRDREPQQALVQQVNSYGHSKSMRRPANLTLEQSVAARKSDPTVIRLKKKLEQIPRRTGEHAVARRKLKAAQKKALLSAKAKMRQEWSHKQAQEDIERQIQGHDISQEQEQAPPARRGRGRGSSLVPCTLTSRG